MWKINKHSCRVAGPSGHDNWQSRRYLEGTVGLVLVGGQVVSPLGTTGKLEDSHNGVVAES